MLDKTRVPLTSAILRLCSSMPNGRNAISGRSRMVCSFVKSEYGRSSIASGRSDISAIGPLGIDVRLEIGWI